MPAKLIDFYSGWQKYNDLIIKAIAPLREDQLSQRPATNMWSVRTLAEHIVATRAWWLGGWMGEDSETLMPLIDFDDGPGADRRDAKTITEFLGITFGSLTRCLERWTEADLDQRFQRPRPNDQGECPWRTRGYIVWHVAEHDLHHGGEISLILGMHGGKGLDL